MKRDDIDFAELRPLSLGDFNFTPIPKRTRGRVVSGLSGDIAEPVCRREFASPELIAFLKAERGEYVMTQTKMRARTVWKNAKRRGISARIQKYEDHWKVWKESRQPPDYSRIVNQFLALKPGQYVDAAYRQLRAIREAAKENKVDLYARKQRDNYRVWRLA